MDCSKCKRRELWVLDCDLAVECPNKIREGCHYHYKCGLCGHEEIHNYDDDPMATEQSAFAVLDRAREYLKEVLS